MSKSFTIDLIAGARPNFMKIAPLYHALKNEPWANVRIVHTDQHWDPNMSEFIFRDLGLPKPNYSLGAGGGTQGEVTAKVLVGYEKVCIDSRPDIVIVVGDVNSTIAASLAAVKLGIPVAHLEAGLRSRDRTMPEEINRLLTDQIVDLLWTPSPDAEPNLLAEGISKEKIVFVGNIMIDSLEMLRPQIEADNTRKSLGLEKDGYCIVTLHRPSNVDSKEKLVELVDLLCYTAKRLPVVYPTHPRTLAKIKDAGLFGKLEAEAGIKIIEPAPYIQFMNLLFDCRMALTDSGGLQEETSYLGKPCLTIRDNTERPITVMEGTNKLVNLSTVRPEIDRALSSSNTKRPSIKFWDGKTAFRTVASLKQFLGA